MEYSLKWDTDNDGIIDNAGFADQTYDAWSMYGARYDDNIFFWFHTFSSLRSDLNLNDQNVLIILKSVWKNWNSCIIYFW